MHLTKKVLAMYINLNNNSKFFTILKSNQVLILGERGKLECLEKKLLEQSSQNQRTQPTHDAESRNKTQDTLVGGKCSPLPPVIVVVVPRSVSWMQD